MGTAKTDYGKVLLPQQVGRGFSVRRLDVARFLMICMILLTIVSIFHVWSRFRLIELNLQVSEASRKLKSLEQEQKQLQLEVASLKTPARIETIAKRDLGMAVPREEQIILVRE
ncbi:cell division protein FtsL [Trichlorobacter ammonificans]|uniref:Cell division protein FtsL n=1 Tax=Trichlorobacter ammonificans TaxID=2916410 RepID=A0ABM9DAP5_9BACT|nr:cell division protein FtsL [Trichlorobacter ammonificans]CAH2032243.1 Cell division protein FtsL [Trichlorobacter ammonificans]